MESILTAVGLFSHIETHLKLIANADHAGPKTFIPVSYTHLDVYKRQTRTRPKSAFELVQVFNHAAPSFPCPGHTGQNSIPG